VEKTMGESNFWDDQERAKKTLKESTRLKRWLDPLQEMEGLASDLVELAEMAGEESDESTSSEIEREANALDTRMDDYELLLMFQGDDDDKAAILTIHPGAGGTESADWAEMLLRMYQRYVERKGWKAKILDYQKADEAGVKSVTVEIEGELAYGHLRAESGVHRLVRISPFDASSRRHTSFASVYVYPEVEEAGEIEVDDKDLKIDTYRAQGAGGQHVNKTDSAVRITHVPTGVVAQSQDERSQHRNRENAMKILLAKLLKKQREEEDAARAELEDSKMEIGFGSQIRSYVFHPYNMVKDHRTSVETGNVQLVMDGGLDEFVEGWLKKSAGMEVGEAGE
jgi:peptide chain release factor 2